MVSSILPKNEQNSISWVIFFLFLEELRAPWFPLEIVWPNVKRRVEDGPNVCGLIRISELYFCSPPRFIRPSYGPASTMPYTALTQRAQPDYFSSSFYLVRVWCKIMVETKKYWWFFSFLQDTEEALIVVCCKKGNHLPTEICTKGQ